MGVLLMLATISAAGAALAAALAGGYFHRPALARGARIAVLLWGAAYSTLLVGTSLTSRERTLRPGEVKRFCGFYLDCHIGAAVADVRRATTLGAPPNQARAAGEYHVVTLRISSNARRATLSLHDPVVTLVDHRGRVYQRSTLGERALSSSVGPALPLDQPLAANSDFTTPVVFDVPRGAANLRLLVADGAGIDRVIQQFLVGDEDSFLHKRTYMALTPHPVGIADGRGLANTEPR